MRSIRGAGPQVGGSDAVGCLECLIITSAAAGRCGTAMDARHASVFSEFKLGTSANFMFHGTLSASVCLVAVQMPCTWCCLPPGDLTKHYVAACRDCIVLSSFTLCRAPQQQQQPAAGRTIHGCSAGGATTILPGGLL